MDCKQEALPHPACSPVMSLCCACCLLKADRTAARLVISLFRDTEFSSDLTYQTA